jgi:hypothetical protein
MGKSSKAQQPKWDLHQRIASQICRYNPGDERPAPSRPMAINGPLLRLAIQYGKRGWIIARNVGGPVSMGTVADLVAVGLVDECAAFVDFDIADGDGDEKRYCLWTLWRSVADAPTLEFIGPTYRELQEIRAREIEKNKLSSSARAAKAGGSSVRL